MSSPGTTEEAAEDSDAVHHGEVAHDEHAAEEVEAEAEAPDEQAEPTADDVAAQEQADLMQAAQTRAWHERPWLRALGAVAVLAGLAAIIPYPLRITAECTVIPSERAKVRSELQGVITEIAVDEAGTVKKGDVIARLDDRALKAERQKVLADIDKLGAELAILHQGHRPEEIKQQTAVLAGRRAEAVFAAREAERRIQMAKDGVGSRQAADAASRELESRRQAGAEAEAALRLLQVGSRPEEIAAHDALLQRAKAELAYVDERLAMTVIRAPIDGAILTPRFREHVHEGVEAGGLVCELANTRRMRAEIMVPERDIDAIERGMPAVIKVESYPTRPFEGKVDFIAPAVEGDDRRIRVVVELDNTDGRLKANMAGYGEVETGSRSLLYLASRRVLRWIRVRFLDLTAMASPALKARDDLIYYDQEIDGDDMVLVRDPIRGTYFRFNPLQAAMLRGLDGKRSAIELVAMLSEQYEVEIPAAAAERFIARARDLMLLDITAYDKTSARARLEVRKALDKAGFRHPMSRALPPTTTPDGARFAAALRQLELDHPRAAAGLLAEILDHDPANAQAKPLYDLVQTAYIKAAGATMDFPSWVLFNPGRMLTWLSRTFGRFIFSWLGVLAMLTVMSVGAYAYTQVSFDRVAFGPLDLLIAIATLTLSNICHEMGHGLACQHYGGDVTEIGLMMFYYVQPAAYCDTSSSYLISRRRHKVIIQMAGCVTSLLFLSVQSMFLTVLHPSVIIYPGLALELLLSSAFVFITLIPLLKFDGYYAISDYFDFANMNERAYKLMWAWLSERLLGLPMATEELPRRTRRWLIAYAASSLLFTTGFMYFAYTRLLNPVVERLRGPGLLLAVVLAIYLMRNLALRPLWNVARLVVRERRQVFTLRRTAALVAVLAALIGPWFVRWPVLIDAEFVALPLSRATVHARVAGRVERVFVREGDRVRRDQPLAQLRDAALDARIAALDGDLAAANAEVALLRHGARAEQLAVARGRLGHARSEVMRNAADARMARDLAAADLGSRSDADTAGVRVAAASGEADDARWGLALLEAGARPEAIAAAEAECARIQSQLVQLRADQTLLTLRSPIDGIVVTPHLELKLQATLAAGDAFADVHDTGSMVAEISLTPRDPLAEIAIGDEVALRAYGDPHREVTARVVQLREAAQDVAGERRIIAVTAAFAPERPVSGLSGHARIYGADRSLAYADLWLPMQRLIQVRLWSMW